MTQYETFDSFLDSVNKRMLIYNGKGEPSENDMPFEEFVVEVLNTALNEFGEEFAELTEKYSVNATVSMMAETLYQRLYSKKHYVKIMPEFSVIEMFIEGKRIVAPVPRLETVIKKRFDLKTKEKGFYLILFYLSSADYYEKIILYETLKSSF